MKRYLPFFWTFSFLLFGQGSSWAQAISPESNAPDVRIGLRLGLEHNLYLDQLATPLIYKGNGMKFGLDYRRQNARSQLGISLNYAHLNEEAKYHPYRILYITPLEYIPELDISGDTVLRARVDAVNLPHIGLRIAYYRNIMPDKIHRFTASVGGSFASDIRIPASDNVIIFTPVWLNEFNLAVKGRYEFTSGLKLSLGADLPVLALAVRLPYSISPVEPGKGVYKSAFLNGKTVTWPEYRSARAFLEIDYPLNKKIDFQLNISGYYLHYDYPKSIRFLQYDSSIGISCIF